MGLLFVLIAHLGVRALLGGYGSISAKGSILLYI
jgi:hypothetical protein